VKREFRLRRPADFKRVRRHGKSQAHPFIVLFVLSNQGEGLRVGVAAGKTVGSAVHRNRAKRVLRAAIGPLLAELATNHDLLLMARPGMRETKSTDLQPIIKDLLAKAGLM
jgi:ribonuclease P protein component